MIRRARPGLASVAVAAVVGLLAVSAPGSSGQDAPPEAPGAEIPELPPAPPGLTAELSTMYSTAHRILLQAADLGAVDPSGDPVEPPEDPAGFNEDLAQLEQDDLDLAYAAIVEIPDWVDVQPTLDELADVTGQTVEMQELLESPEPGSAESPSMATVSSFGSPDPGIEPPPGAFEPSSPVEPGEGTPCPPPPPGGSFGNLPIFQAKIGAIAVKAVFKLIPKFFFAVESIQSPVSLAFAALSEVVDLVEVALGYLKDRYQYCEGENQYVFMFSAENTALGVWELMRRSEETLANVNDGVIIVSDQLKAAQAASDEVLAADIHQALTAPLDATPNVAYQLPASEGGLLDAEPIGVQSIVTRSLESAQRAGLPVNGAAPVLLAQADDALAQGRFADAYRLYQRAYQELGG